MRARKIIRRSIWTFAILATVVAFLYAEEDWRGARALRAAENEFSRRGETLDYTKFIPPSIPAEQNLAALPLFAFTPQSKDQRDQDPQFKALRKALTRTSRDYPGLGNFRDGREPDMPTIRAAVRADFAKIFPKETPPASSVEQLERLFPFLAELREESARRPFCRFESNYDTNPPFRRPLGLLLEEISMANLLALDAGLAENERNGTIALEDLRPLFVLAQGARVDPSVVGKLIDMGMKANAMNAVREGLVLHVWNDAQLTQLQATLAGFDFLSDFRAGLLSEAPHDVPNYDYFKRHPENVGNLSGPNEEEQPWQFWALFFRAWPAGWYDQNEARLLQFHLRLIDTVDVHARRFHLDRWKQLSVEARLNTRGVSGAWNLLFKVASEPLSYVATESARAQTWMEAAVLACAMERYRLVHRKYPDSLEALRPDEITTIPHDVITGGPLHYELLPDGSYRIYSVGLDEKDDGGKIVYVPNGAKARVDEESGDWVWFGAK